MPDVVVPGETVCWSTNHDDGRKAGITTIVIHATRGGASATHAEYQSTINFCRGANSNRSACPHYVVGDGECCRMVHDRDTAWGAGDINPWTLHIEVAQQSWQPPFTEGEYRRSAEITARWCLAYNLPPVHVHDEHAHGYIGHEETAQGRGEGKTDPGHQWNWTHFGVLVRAESDRLRGVVSMTATEQSACGQIAQVVYSNTHLIGDQLAKLETVLGGETPYTKAIKAEIGLIYDAAVTKLKVTAGLQNG